MEKIKQYRLPVTIASLVVVILFGRYVLNVSSNEEEVNVDEETQELTLDLLLDTEVYEEEDDDLDKEDSPILVDVKGAVVSPGVYELSKGERVDHAIKKAGGLIEEAEANAVNFAKQLTDEMLIYVPYKGEEGSESAFVPDLNVEQDTHLINVNTAEMTVLLELNGIGPQKAQAIIDYRETNGLFSTIEELTDVSGIGIKTLEKIQNQITVD